MVDTLLTIVGGFSIAFAVVYSILMLFIYVLSDNPNWIDDTRVFIIPSTMLILGIILVTISLSLSCKKKKREAHHNDGFPSSHPNHAERANY